MAYSAPRASASSGKAKTSAWPSSSWPIGASAPGRPCNSFRRQTRFCTASRMLRSSWVNLLTIRGLSQFGGVDMFLRARAGQSRAQLTSAQKTLLDEAGKSPILTGTRANSLPEAPQLQIAVDRVQAANDGVVADRRCTAGDSTAARAQLHRSVQVPGGRVKRVYCPGLMRRFGEAPTHSSTCTPPPESAVPPTGASAGSAAQGY